MIGSCCILKNSSLLGTFPGVTDQPEDYQNVTYPAPRPGAKTITILQFLMVYDHKIPVGD